MSLAKDFLRDYLTREKLSQAEFARQCELTQSNLSLITSGEVEISGRNVARLARGFGDESSQLDFLACYLRDEIPTGFASRLDVAVRSTAAVAETSQADTTSELLASFAALPSKKLRLAVVQLLQQLRTDAEFRDLFIRTMAYAGKEDVRSLARAQASGRKPADFARRDADPGINLAEIERAERELRRHMDEQKPKAAQ